MKKSIVLLVVTMLLMWTGLGYSQCVGPYDYEQLNQDTQRIMNEYIEVNQEFCDNNIYGIEFKVIPSIVAIVLYEGVRDKGNFTRNPQTNAKLRMALNAEIMKLQMVVRIVDYNLQKTDRRRYYMWLDSQQKIKQALRSNHKIRKMINDLHADLVQKANN